jgi:Pyridine nucleotide-disulphide oxidoreductase
MNAPPSVRDLLGVSAPATERLLLGSEMVEEVLEPLAAHPVLAGRVRTGHRVVALGRAGLTRGELAGHPLRAERPFRAVMSTPGGEAVVEADAVLDASGAGLPAHFGSGGLPARGEREHGSAVLRHLGDLEAALPRLEERHVLVLGHGHSAATAILRLSEAASGGRGTRVTWAFRSANRRPCAEVADDPLPERQRTASAANDLAAAPPSWLAVERRATVEEVARDGRNGDGFAVALSGGRSIHADAFAAFTGYRPDASFLSELGIELGAATEGNALLERALSNVTDCLSVPCVAPADLETSEPGFFFAGARSYGRSRTFLLRTGFAHLESMLERIAGSSAGS